MSPVLVTANLQNKKVKEVACGSHHSMVLTHDGEVAVLFITLQFHHYFLKDFFIYIYI